MLYKLIIEYCHFIVRNGNHNNLLSTLIKILKKKNESWNYLQSIKYKSCYNIDWAVVT